MAFSLIVDDTSLVLLLTIILLLAVSILLGKAYQPLIHPLILSRQSDVSAVQHKGQSSIYRNANSPSGFDLSTQPRRAISTVHNVLTQGSGAEEWNFSRKRTLYGLDRSNEDVYVKARDFGRGLANVLGNGQDGTTAGLAVAVCVEADSIKSLEVMLSGDVQPNPKVNRFSPMVIAPAHLKAGHAPTSLPTSVAQRAKALHAVFTTAVALSRASKMPLVDDSTVFVFETAGEVQEAGKKIKNKAVTFDDIVAQAPLTGTNEKQDAHDASKAVHSAFWAGQSGWIEASNASLIAGLTAHLGFFPADSQPGKNDHIYVEQSPYLESPSFRLGAASTPAGLVLAVLALYTGSSLTASTISSSFSDLNPVVSDDFGNAGATIVFCSAVGGSAMAACLCTVSKRSPLARLAAHTKLAALRHGTFTKTGLWDSLLFQKTRMSAGCEHVRSVMVLTEGPTIQQGLLDVLRAQLGCAVRPAYLPANPLHQFDKSINAGVGTTSSDSRVKYALSTAPIATTHSLDLQAFAAHPRDVKQVPAHVGPPNVTVEVKLVETQLATSKGLAISGLDAKQDAGRAQDPIGEIFVRGTSIAGAESSEQWCATGDLGTFRSNGTLVVILDRNNSPEVDVPTLSSEYPSSRRTSRIGAGGHQTRVTPLMTIIALLVFVCSDMAEAYSPEHSASRSIRQLTRRDTTINATFVDTAIMGFTSAQRASWEQGVAHSALLEYQAGSWSVFAGDARPPYLLASLSGSGVSLPINLQSMAYAAANSQDNAGQLCSRITGDERSTEGSALDPASCGEAVLLAAYSSGQISNYTVDTNSFYGRAASRQLDYLLNTAPKIPGGAISMRSSGEVYWSDGVYMAPPFIALFGLMTRNQTLLQMAYDQVRLYRDALRIPSGAAQGLFRHIVNASVPDAPNNDLGAWLTGNAWSAAGMCRVLGAIAQSDFVADMASQVEDLANWTSEIVVNALQQGDPLMHNYINDTSTFQDAGGSAMIAYAAYRLASMAPGANLSAELAQSEAIYNTVQDKLEPSGQLVQGTSVVDQLVFSASSQGSPESMAFMTLLAAARRDYGVKNVTGIAGPGTGVDGAMTQSASSSTIVAAIVVAALASAILL